MDHSKGNRGKLAEVKPGKGEARGVNAVVEVGQPSNRGNVSE